MPVERSMFTFVWNYLPSVLWAVKLLLLSVPTNLHDAGMCILDLEAVMPEKSSGAFFPSWT